MTRLHTEGSVHSTHTHEHAHVHDIQCTVYAYSWPPSKRGVQLRRVISSSTRRRKAELND